MQEVPQRRETVLIETETGTQRGRIRDDRSIGELFRELADETRSLVQQEIQLAKAEMGQKVEKITNGATSTGIGGVVALAGLITLCGAASAGLFALMAWAEVPFLVNVWLSPLVVAIVVGVIGYALIQSGINNFKKERLAPTRTTDSLRETKEWMQEKLT